MGLRFLKILILGLIFLDFDKKWGCALIFDKSEVDFYKKVHLDRSKKSP